MNTTVLMVWATLASLDPTLSNPAPTPTIEFEQKENCDNLVSKSKESKEKKQAIRVVDTCRPLKRKFQKNQPIETSPDRI